MKSKRNILFLCNKINIGFVLIIILSSCSLNKVQVDSNVFKPFGENTIFPQPVGYVNDFEGIFTESQIKELNVIINRHELETTNQIAIVTIGSIEPYNDISEFTIDLANYWRIGHKDHKNGVLIAFSTKLKKIQI